MWQFLYKHFQLAGRKTSWKKEIIGGLITFFAMMYILPVNAELLNDQGKGIPEGAVYLATAIISGLSSILIGMFSNLPIGIAPGMGSNTFFVGVMIHQFMMSFDVAFSIVIINGLIFTLLSCCGIISKFVNAIPASLKEACVFGLGFYLAFIGLKNSQLIITDASGLALGDFKEIAVILTLIGIILVFVLTILKWRLAILITLLSIALLGMIIGQALPNHVAHNLNAFTDINFNYQQLTTIDQIFGQGILAIPQAFSDFKTYIILVALIFMTITTSSGVIVSVGNSAHLITPEGKVPKAKEALVVTGIASMAAGVCGTTPMSGFLESNAGTTYGARTGFSAIIVGLMFFLSIALFPILQPLFGHAFVTSPILVFVGASMAQNGNKIEWQKLSIASSAFMLIAMMIFTSSILNGFAFGVITYVIFEIASGKAKAINIHMYIFALLFLGYLIAMPFIL